ncbi:MAG TPA: YqgE/AlgH family protein, partial [Mycobacterium sp.]|nr:YqgE/AlgH family protein [Mycobacterium sp.]
GIVINRPLDVHLSEILEQMDIATEDNEIANRPVYLGGPVQQDRGFVLHKPLADWQSTLPVTENVAVTTSRDILAAIARGDGPTQCLVALGYAGWGAGQLEQEIAGNAWLSGPADEHILFESPAEARWEAAAKLLGVDLHLLSGDAGHA